MNNVSYIAIVVRILPNESYLTELLPVISIRQNEKSLATFYDLLSMLHNVHTAHSKLLRVYVCFAFPFSLTIEVHFAGTNSKSLTCHSLCDSFLNNIANRS